MPLDPISTGLSVLQTGFGLFQTISASDKLKKLTAQQTPYQTPEQIQQMLDLAKSQVGGDTITRDFETNQIDRAFGDTLDLSKRLGADPNDLSALFDKKVGALLKVGNDFHVSNMQSFANLTNAFNIMAANKAAEQKSKQDILKDKIQATAGQVQAGYANISGGVNTGLSSYMASKEDDLYNSNK